MSVRSRNVRHKSYVTQRKRETPTAGNSDTQPFSCPRNDGQTKTLTLHFLQKPLSDTWTHGFPPDKHVASSSTECHARLFPARARGDCLLAAFDHQPHPSLPAPHPSS
uniref:Uncharacterized protein n=1 Tax=Panagrellus redivivus TaxID=6233 RepID=A0A7E4UQ13_PANRE